MARLAGALIGLGLLAMPMAALAAPIPRVVVADPKPDKANPPRMFVFPLPSGGVHINAMLYTASGAGPHPSVILFGGLPGAEINSDLAYAIRRAGWNVVIPRYRGSWGSAGQFTFAHCLEDGQAAVAWLRHPSPDLASHIDPNRIVVMGHSMGGWVAGYTAAHDPGILGAALISSGSFAKEIADAPREQVIASMAGNIQEGQDLHMLGDATGQSLGDELIHNAGHWDLADYGEGLARHPLLIITADDGLKPVDDAIAVAARAHHGRVANIHFTTNHGYNDHRIALGSVLVRWLDGLPGAPRP